MSPTADSSTLQHLEVLSNIMVAWPEKTYLVSAQHGLVYIPIPKNACSNVKRWMLKLCGLHAEHNHFDHTRQGDIHHCDKHFGIHDCASKELTSEEMLEHLKGDAHFRFTVVRNPWARAVSCFLSKFCNYSAYPQIVSQLNMFLGSRGESVTFRQFVTQICATQPCIDVHWAPQWLFLCRGFDGKTPVLHDLDLIGRFEQLEECIRTVGGHLGVDSKLDTRTNSVRYQTSAAEPVLERSWADVPSMELRAHKREHGAYPSTRLFYDADLVESVRETYRWDITLFGYEGGAPQIESAS